MATNEERLRRGLGSIDGTIPAAPSVPLRQGDPNAPPPRMPTVGQRLREAVAQTPRDIGRYARDVARDPLREAEIALAPFPGGGRTASALRAGFGMVRPAAGMAARGAPGLRRARDVVRPQTTKRDLLVAGTTTAGAGLAFAHADRNDTLSSAPTPTAAAPSRRPIFVDPDESRASADARARTLADNPNVRADQIAAGTFQVGDGPARTVYTTEAERTASREAEARQRDLPERVVASRNRAEDVAGITRRSVQDINSNTLNTANRIASRGMNPFSADAIMRQRMYNDMQFYGRRSPSIRQAIMAQYGAQMGDTRAADLAGVDAGNRAIVAGAGDEARAHETFAERRDRANMFNTTTSEARRAGDLDRMGSYLEALARAQGDQAKLQADMRKERRDIFNREREALRAEGMPWDQATAVATQRLDDMNLGGSSLPEGVGARTREAAAMERSATAREMGGLGGGIAGLVGLGGLRRDVSDWLAGTSSNAEVGTGVFNPDNYDDAQDPTWRQRAWSAVLPDNGELAWPTVVDRASGRRIRVHPDALGGSTEGFNRRRLESRVANY